MRRSLFDISYKGFLFFVLGFLFFVLAGCEKFDFLKPRKEAKVTALPVAVKGMVIAKVNNLPVTLEELNMYVDMYNASLDLRQDLTVEQKTEAKIDNREKKIDYLKSRLIRQAVFYQAAVDRGLDRKEEIAEILQRNKTDLLAGAMQNEIARNIDVSSAEIEDAYKANKDLFKEPEVRKIQEIVTRTEEEARPILIELLQGGDFATIAKTRSIAESAKNGGDLGFIKRGQRGEQFLNFDDVAFSPALQQGAISSVFKGSEGYYIIKVEGMKEGKEISLSEAWDTIKTLLLAKKQSEELDKVYSQLSREAKIEIYEGEVK